MFVNDVRPKRRKNNQVQRIVKRPAGVEREGRSEAEERPNEAHRAARRGEIIARQGPFEPDSDFSIREPPWECCWNGTNTASSASAGQRRNRSADHCKTVLGRSDDSFPLFRYATVSAVGSICAGCGICCKTHPRGGCGLF